VAHVEAGLRSFHRAMQEEINRVVADHLSELLFAPTDAAVRNLAREGIDASKVHLVGDVMYDVSLHFAAAARMKSTILETLSLAPKSYALATIHRAENTDDPARLRAIFDGLAIAARTLPVVVPLHPRTKRALGTAVDSLRIIEPVGYLDMLRLEESAAVIATDSGGVQKEAYFHRVPCVTLRDETEWVELIDLAWNRLCAPVSADAIGAAIVAAIGTTGDEHRAPYGDGNAATRIAQRISGERLR
ncbi:MAG TPA: UDP-N-acetylglucosamine 2-epimerase, partial [Thermoanaerobaculia bacterium]|nr:UDP-N-acetylglucosamine 2-epimerase [Thermoanaerobaculia bacterium]